MSNRGTASCVGPLNEPTERVSRGWIALIAFANLGLFSAYLGPLAVLLPNQVQAVGGSAHKIVSFAWVTGVGALVAVVVNPLAGALSDRTVGRFGRRHPWTLGGALVGAAALLLLAHQHTIPGIVAGWALAQAGLNAMQAGVAAGVPDRVPVAQRGAVSGWIGIAQTLAGIIGVTLVAKITHGHAGYALLAVTVVALVLPFVFCAPDVQLARADQPKFDWRGFLGSFWLSPVRHPDFGWAWLTRFLMVLGNSMAVLYLLYFLRDQADIRRLIPGHSAENGLVILLAIYTVMVITTTVVGGTISDRSGRRRRSVAIAGIVMAVPALLLGGFPTWPSFLVAAAILGAGFGIYLSVDQALVTQVLPSAAGRAKDLGVISVASSAGQAMAPVLAVPLVSYLGGYSALYFCVAGIVMLGSVSVWQVRSVP
jgi:MFS family permease